ncbi:hypothetical protein GH714_032031 [Hevea brasiliensis]|uniref:AB hydrolase-1 domain-containing protein n=1 Tax=Hevea brasiliensis TaxID=3981 RepID=A0A6A6M7A7_HEVBR|nr:hypothetical protein GH714_032031 [Hevea brasiliensis]
MIKQLFPEVESQNWTPSSIQPIWRTVWETQTTSLREGIFKTPCDEQLLSALPHESHAARVAFLAPKSISPQKMACVVHLAGTGDHSFERRLRLGAPLLKQNIATMVLESPFYGHRRPMLQRGAKLLCVSDLLLLGRATIEETRSLLHWLDFEAGFGKMGVCGFSMVQETAMTLEEVQKRMRNVLSLTDVTRFPIPKNPSAVIFVAATDDGYIPKHSVLELQKAWPGSEVRWVTGGHVSSFLLHNDEFRKAIVDGLNRLEWKESPL